MWSPVTAPATTLITGYVILIDDGRTGPFVIAHDGSINPQVFESTIYGLKA
jgi:hypothetical protein